MKVRERNIELLRIFAMIMIISLHFLGHGGVLVNVSPYSIQYYVCWILEGLCFISVNCYVLISGYFLIDSKFKIKKLLILLGQVFFFSISLYLITSLLSGTPFSKVTLLKAVFPTNSNVYWFVTMYVGMYILSPFINTLLKNLTQKQHFLLICVSVTLFSILPTLFFYSTGLNFGGGNGVVWFIVLYIVAAYIKKYKRVIKNVHKVVLLYGICAVMVPISFFGLDFIANKLNSEFLLQHVQVMYSYNSIFVFFASVFAFLLFFFEK